MEMVRFDSSLEICYDVSIQLNIGDSRDSYSQMVSADRGFKDALFKLRQRKNG